VVRGKFTQRAGLLRVQIREPLAVHAHAGAQVATCFTNEALRHRGVALRFSRVLVCKNGEAGAEPRVICRLGAGDKLPHFERVQDRRGFLLCRGDAGESHDCGSNRKRLTMYGFHDVQPLWPIPCKRPRLGAATPFLGSVSAIDMTTLERRT
jgi:hypothetical protein